MEIQKTNEINSLLTFYGDLLTEKQRVYIELYYAEDYSLGEIAENFDVSRQAVYDNIRRTEKSLLKYENHLHLARDYYAREAVGDEMAAYVAEHYPDDIQLQLYLSQLIAIDNQDGDELVEDV
ncbi:MAG: DNA-binding protein [Aerococcus viridans]|jgi:predicted DNA-binding protein YlxM (UPF0122 family)|nr:MAG: DNA-binding protein [Aerococcus viridans]